MEEAQARPARVSLGNMLNNSKKNEFAASCSLALEKGMAAVEPAAPLEHTHARPPLALRYAIDPLNKYRIAWDYLVAVLALVVAFKVSFEVGFKVFQSPALWAVDSVLDVLFCVDILIVLRTRSPNEWGSKGPDAARYLKGACGCVRMAWWCAQSAVHASPVGRGGVDCTVPRPSLRL